MSRVGELEARLGRAEPRARLRVLVRRTEEAARRLGRWQTTSFPRERLRLERIQARLEPANVTKLLERGFALVLREGGGVVTSSACASPGEALRIALAQGWLDVRVTARDQGDDPLPSRVNRHD